MIVAWLVKKVPALYETAAIWHRQTAWITGLLFMIFLTTWAFSKSSVTIQN